MRKVSNEKTGKISRIAARAAAGAMAGLMVAGTALTAVPYNVLADEVIAEWREENGVKYWYENGVKQGTEGRGKEIYDPESDAWYWLDAVDGGKMTVSKDVYQESGAGQWGDNTDENGEKIGKWVRYDENGHMVKGWNEKDGNRYYFDPVYGTMAKGDADIDGVHYYFNKDTGILESGGQTDDDGRAFTEDGWHKVDGVNYWYENGVRQGVKYKEDGSIDDSYRGKEIYDPSSDAWYWLDCVQNGAVAKNKDVYQESAAGQWGAGTNENGEKVGKWVHYDENGHMVKGWNEKDGNKYYFDPVYGTMAKGILNFKPVDESYDTYCFDNTTGVLLSETVIEVNGVRYKVYKDGTCSIISKLKNIKYLNSSDEITSSIEFIFDDEGKNIKRTSYNSDGTIAGYMESIYDDNGKCVKYINTFDRTWVDYEYNSSGKETKSVYYDVDGNIKYQYFTEYDADGSTPQKLIFEKNGSVENVTEYSYDGEILSKEISYLYKTDGSFYKDCT